MRLSQPNTPVLLCLIALTFTACNSGKDGADANGSGNGQAAPAQGSTTVSSDGKVNMSAHAGTIHQLTAEMVNLMEDVSNKKIMSPPLKVSDVRNAFFERLDWLDQMTAEDVAKLKQTTADLDALIAEIRAHANAAGDQALEVRLKKIEDWNLSIKAGFPK
jgi:hypothetical protein